MTGRPRRRAVGAGARYQLVFADRLLVTLVQLRRGTTQDVLARWFGLHRSTISRAINEVPPLFAERGCRVEPGVRLRALAEVIAYLGASGQTAIMDATEVRVRRPQAGDPARSRFTSGKSRSNAVKALVFTDERGRLLYCEDTLPGSCADITQAHHAGVVSYSTGPWTCRSSPTPATRVWPRRLAGKSSRHLVSAADGTCRTSSGSWRITNAPGSPTPRGVAGSSR